jgi:hypothetical protein
MEAIRSSEMSVLTKATRRHIPEDGILQMLSVQIIVGSVSTIPAQTEQRQIQLSVVQPKRIFSGVCQSFNYKGTFDATLLM